MLIWIIMDAEDKYPIIAASSKKIAEEKLFEYMGYENNTNTDTLKYLEYIPMVYSEFEGDFEGTYKFEIKYKIDANWERANYYLYSLELDAPQKF